MKKAIYILWAICGLAGSISAQDTIALLKKTYYPKARVAALNMTPLLTHLIPFNRVNPQQSGPFQARFRYYRKGSRAFRFGLGVGIDPDDVAGKNFLHLQLGLERRFNISERWAYYRISEIIGSIGPLNIPGEDNTNVDDTGGIGLGFGLGIEFALAPRITLTTETELIGLLSGEGLGIRFIPPVGLFLNYYIN